MNDEHLYHYTTAEGLKGIVEKCEIWASDIFSLNDKSEIYHGRDMLLDHLKKNTLSEEHGGRKRQQFITALEGINPEKVSPTYVCSFSQEHNDLSQWRAYCPHGGYAIGLPQERLGKLASDRGFALYKCAYDQ